MHYLLLLLLCSIYVEEIEGDIRNAEVVYPERIHAHRSKRDLSTQLKANQHEDSLTFRIKSKQEGDLVVDLKREEPVRDSLLVRTYADDGTPIHTYHDHPNCFYSGSIQDKRDSYAYVSSCNGLTGSLDTGTRRYDIEPHEENGGHKFYNVDDEIENIAKSLKIVTGDVKDIMETLRDENDDDDEEEGEEGEEEDISVIEATSSSVFKNDNRNYGPALAWKGESWGSRGFFLTIEEDNPWLQIKLNKVARITSVTLINRNEDLGEQLRNVEVRAGMEPGLGNEVVGEFKGPGWTGGIHGIIFKEPVDAQFLTFQVRGRGILQINGIRFNQAKVPVVKWREDLKCGVNNKLPNGETSECDPNSVTPCCNAGGFCGNSSRHCFCEWCTDYRYGKSTLLVNKPSSEASENVTKFELFNVEKQYVPYITYPYTRYVEQFVSIDTGLYLRWNKDTNLCIERVLNAVGMVDKSYSSINIRLVVVALEIQNNGAVWERIEKTDDLGRFRYHVNKILREDAFKDIPIDNAQFFSPRWWNPASGVAYGDSLCRSYSAAVNSWVPHAGVTGPTIIFGHELGHNFGWADYMGGEPGTCPCLSIPLRRGCFMGGHKGSRPGFNICNMKRFAVRNNRYHCLNNRPVNPLHTRCGNGIREKGEECDCGTPENCAREDPCCEPQRCKLKAEAQCNFLNDPACCERTCQFKRQGSLCREATSNCDVPEYCTGETAICPADRFMKDGTHCGESKKLVLGTNRWKTHFRELTPRVIGRYFKIIPVHWTKDQKACMKLEMYGCGPNEASSGEKRGAVVVDAGDCWGKCRGKGGRCERCGTDGYCCRRGWKDCPEELAALAPNHHTCVRYTDCAKPLGLGNKEIPDSAISAAPSSSPASDVRMGSGGFWCSANKEDGSWIKVDVGKEVEVRYIAIQGLNDKWVDAFHVMYSDNGFVWKYYKENNDDTNEGSNSYCSDGECSLTHDHQCRKLWDVGASSASDKCWNKLNTNNEGYGTCNPTEISPCDKSNVKCGQIQCTSAKSSPYYENYGKDYKTVTIDGQKCSAAKIVNANDDIGEGMVRDGTKCGDGKICINQECKTLKGKISCALVNGKMCGGRGQCMENGKCFCDGVYNPEDDCATEIAAVDGGWNEWSPWSECTAKCKQRRHRFCNHPFAKHNGKDCVGDRVEEKECKGTLCLDVGMVPGPVIGKTIRGKWSEYATCPPQKRIIGFRLKVKKEGNGAANDDDTALKGIDLFCEGNTASATIEKEGGTWNTWKSCQDEYVKKIDFLATTNVRVECTKEGLDGGIVLVGEGESGGEWGGYTACPSGTIFCGARAQIEEGAANAFNRIQLACCPETEVVKRWRDDGRCGLQARLSNYEKGECNPKASPCCSDRGWCAVPSRRFCDCAGCIDYRFRDINVVEATSSSVLANNNGKWGPMLAWKGESGTSTGYFHSIYENKPWLQIKLNKVASITNVTVINRKDCCGGRLRNLEVRAGMEPGLTNEVAGEFKGPGRTKGQHVITFKKPVDAQYLTFQLKGKGILQINGIRFNQPKEEESHSNVWCGGHPAYDCSGCPQGHGAGWCNGQCKWCNGACQLKNKCV